MRTEHQNGRVVLSVSDNGCGMSPAFLKDSLFRPFEHQNERAGYRAVSGPRHRSGAWGQQVESELGKGTTFQVSLPARDER